MFLYKAGIIIGVCLAQSCGEQHETKIKSILFIFILRSWNAAERDSFWAMDAGLNAEQKSMEGGGGWAEIMLSPVASAFSARSRISLYSLGRMF